MSWRLWAWEFQAQGKVLARGRKQKLSLKTQTLERDFPSPLTLLGLRKLLAVFISSGTREDLPKRNGLAKDKRPDISGCL